MISEIDVPQISNTICSRVTSRSFNLRFKLRAESNEIFFTIFHGIRVSCYCGIYFLCFKKKEKGEGKDTGKSRDKKGAGK